MTVTKLFRFELKIKVDINVETIKETDYGRNRYTKQLLNQLVKDREAVRVFMIINLFSRYINDDSEISQLLDTGKNEDFYILRAAKKCPPEVQSFFKDLFGSRQGAKKGSKGPDFKSDESIENERLFEHLHFHLANMVPVKAAFSELPGEILNHDHDHDKVKRKEMEN
jgi:hypothetical protein